MTKYQLLFFCLGCTLTWIVVMKSNNIPTTSSLTSSHPAGLLYSDWKDCIEIGFRPFKSDPTKFWLESPRVISACHQSNLTKRLAIQGYQNRDELKRHILPKTGEPSVIVTMGVGHDATAEEKLKKELPAGSLFFGADPMWETNNVVYSTVGQFFPFAVGAEAGTSTASVLTGGAYKDQMVVHVDIIYFLKNLIKKQVFDSIWLDAEGAEYGMFPHFLKGGLLDQNDIIVCQMNLEIHNPDDAKKVQIRDFFSNLLKDERYMFFHTELVYLHMRTYLLNVEHPACLKRYVL